MKGVGSYTAGAIASFAFRQRAPAVDGNVFRVVTRYFALEGSISKKEIEEYTLSLLPEKEPWIVMEALIELGATLCQKTPFCQKCPLQPGCKAFLLKKTKEIPFVKKTAKIEHLSKSVAIIFCEGFVLVEKKEEGKVLGGLMEFPSFDYSVEQSIEKQVQEHLALNVCFQEDLSKESYTFTRYKVDLYPSLLTTQEKKEIEGLQWKSLEELCLLTFSSGHKRILQKLFHVSV
jgi:A/G-specific adenine glycosylase